MQITKVPFVKYCFVMWSGFYPKYK